MKEKLAEAEETYGHTMNRKEGDALSSRGIAVAGEYFQEEGRSGI